MTREEVAERLHVAGCMNGEAIEGCTFDLCTANSALGNRPDPDFWLRMADEAIRMCEAWRAKA